jgi:hypothetical protein
MRGGERRLLHERVLLWLMISYDGVSLLVPSAQTSA